MSERGLAGNVSRVGSIVLSRTFTRASGEVNLSICVSRSLGV